MDSPYLWSEERDYPKIVQRYTQAAERQHWKAMMNLVTLQIEGRGLPRDPEAVVKRVEAAMQLGIPAAYDRMGTLYQRGIGVKGDATRAFAFFQRAADMGSPESQTYLGGKWMRPMTIQKEGFGVTRSSDKKCCNVLLRKAMDKPPLNWDLPQEKPATEKPTPDRCATSMKA